MISSQEIFEKPALSPKQLQFYDQSTKKYNLAHGSVRSGKTVVTLLAFLREVVKCPGKVIMMFGNSQRSIYVNLIMLLFESPILGAFRNYIEWHSSGILYFYDKRIICVGCGDEGALGTIMGSTIDLCYCDEFTLYPDNIVYAIQTRLSRKHSKLYASMNPREPSHRLKKWIDASSHPSWGHLYYSLHFTLDDNPYVDDEYKEDLKNSLSGVFYKRNYLGLWTMAEGAVYDFFDRQIHVVGRPPKAAEYWIAGMDYGFRNAFALVLIGVTTGRFDQQSKKLWVEKEYYWDSSKTGIQKTNQEYLQDVKKMLEDYPVRAIYMDPSAASFKFEMQKARIHVVADQVNNDVNYGIETVAKLLKGGDLVICSECVNLIREIETYVWDQKKIETGKDAPLKKGASDHALDALRYAIATHKVIDYKQQVQMMEEPFPASGQWPMNFNRRTF